ncbi:neuropilin and tolloid-like protein 1 isoform X1 [Pecten maximus]|uniref:neuropilin and tolloid-like protein 1 isoform X1 n=1 Tax=Pecten maximus TaxID=6579 RepID=UPI001458D3CF|nr:neuropilin and tolloid-like protein 1 isoform X1 [Pecten maximus]
METLAVICILAWMLAHASALQTYYMEEGCGASINMMTRNEDSIILRLSRNPTHRPNQDCVIAIEPPLGKDLSVTFRDLDVESGPTGQCATDFLRMYDGRSGQAQFVQGLPQTICGNNNMMLTRSYETRLGYLTLQFQSRSQIVNRRGFELLISAFRRGPCQGGETQCYNGRCINNNLRCSGYDHCGDGTNLCPLPLEASVALGVGGIVVLVIIIAIIGVCIYKKKRSSSMKDEITKEQMRKEQYHNVSGESIRVKTASNGSMH